MAFQFRYQRVLDIREMQEDQEKSEFARLQQRVIEERDKLEDLKQQLSEMLEQARRSREGEGNIQDFIQVQEYSRMLKEQIAEQQDVLEEWEEKLEEQREQLVEASQERQVMENLKERDYEEFQEERRRQEQNLNNELATRQHYRNYLEDE